MKQLRGEIILAGLLIGLAVWAAVYSGVAMPALAQTTDTPAPPVRVTSGPPTVNFPTPLIAVTGPLKLNLETATPTPPFTGTVWVAVTRNPVFQITVRPYGGRNLATLTSLKVHPLVRTPTATPLLVLTIVLPTTTRHPRLPGLSTVVGLPLHFLLTGTPTMTPTLLHRPPVTPFPIVPIQTSVLGLPLPHYGLTAPPITPAH
jgi:hypothetical protein